ncbi:hypothetical protein D3C72_2018840 [compost metagenome]
MEGLLIQTKKTQSDGVPESQQTNALWRETDRSPNYVHGSRSSQTREPDYPARFPKKGGKSCVIEKHSDPTGGFATV